ncbi:GNAT superfamily N-acetyltransferase [Pullulanibacillus pueri]|uniref:N-acetyltransferase domain-containing protein n=1 Tax=Pullulanibacillus pueri TaxID=1437324 RepID=A0A8J2ZZI4_9BACL|nr:GNAT family N-acetyltransferase [Pullulanibacillus pueri]MBM7680563.1 GNAT superfamily N-acetyltransferase [Pullulanibacillus pueri]GGH88439.1 hypothetical protein GCM10007096_40780 [Pullulanibacillus pueri]
MHIYEVDRNVDRTYKETLAKLFMQQISVSNDETSFEIAMEAIELALQKGSSSRIIVAEHNSMIYGLAFLNIGVSLRAGGQYLWLNELYVHNEYRNQGIGKKILLHIIHLAESENIKTIELETGVNNSVTKHIYNSLGFYEVVSKRYGFTF